MEVEQMDEQWLQNKEIEFDLTGNFPYRHLEFIVLRAAMQAAGGEKISVDSLSCA